MRLFRVVDFYFLQRGPEMVNANRGQLPVNGQGKRSIEIAGRRNKHATMALHETVTSLRYFTVNATASQTIFMMRIDGLWMYAMPKRCPHIVSNQKPFQMDVSTCRCGAGSSV